MANEKIIIMIFF